MKLTNLMKRAHEIRRKFNLEGHYHVQMKIAMQLAWKEIKQNNKGAVNMNLYEKITFVLRKLVKENHLKPQIIKGGQYKYYIYHENNLSIVFHVYKNQPKKNILVGYYQGKKWVWNIANYIYPSINKKQDIDLKNVILKALLKANKSINDNENLAQKESAITKDTNVSNKTLNDLRTMYEKQFKDISLNNKLYSIYKLNDTISIFKNNNKFAICHTYKEQITSLVNYNDLLTAVFVGQQLKYQSKNINHNFSELLSDDIILIKETIKKGMINAKKKGVNDIYVA